MQARRNSTTKITLDEKFKLVADTIRSYPLQLRQAWDEVQRLYIPQDFKNIQNIIFCGMGGSALGARIIESYTFGSLRIPLKIYNEYKVPGYTNKDSLVVVYSYSGETEETIEATFDALKRHAKIFGITTGGKLAELLKKENLPNYIFHPSYNPSKQPRFAIGYAFGSILSLLARLGFVTVGEEDIVRAVNLANGILTEYHEHISEEFNLAKNYSIKIKNKVPILVASEHLVGCAYTIKNQFNESSKTFSALFELPELNHHLMEGLKNPSKLSEILIFIFINSKLYNERTQKRYKLTCEVVEKNSIDYTIYMPRSGDKLSQIIETLIFGSLVVYYLTKEYKIDPLQIPWVDYFKQRLSG